MRVGKHGCMIPLHTNFIIKSLTNQLLELLMFKLGFEDMIADWGASTLMHPQTGSTPLTAVPTDARNSPNVKEAIIDLADSMQNLGTSRYRFRDFISKMGQMPLFGFWTVNKFE